MAKLLVLLALSALSVCGQNKSASLRNEDVIWLVVTGVPNDTVIKTIQGARSVSFKFLSEDLVLLQGFNVPDDVVRAMEAKARSRFPGLSQVNPATSQPKASGLHPSPPCTYFTVVTQDKLNNVKQGLSPDDAKWFQNTFTKKYPGICYADPAPTVPIVFSITVTPDVYHGTRVVQSTSTHSNPVNGTVTDQDGNTSQVRGTVETATTSSTAVPYSVQYGIFTLSVERMRNDGKFDVLHRFQQKRLYNTLYGIPLGGRGHHPVHAVIEGATKWIDSGGLTDPRQSVVGVHQE